jgi:hypothetical membrane protein
MITTERERRRVLHARAFTWSGIFAAGVLLLAAMWWFPGEAAGMRRGYSFGGDLLSSMGKTRAGSWDNTVSCLIFNGTLILGGAVMAMFWKARATFLTRPRTGTIMRGCGQTMGLAMAGIGLTPCDYFPHAHVLMTHSVIVFGVICFGLCLIGSHREFESVKSKLGWLLILVVAGAAHAVFLLLISQGKIPGSPALPLMQKLFVTLLALWAGWQGFLFGRACRVDRAATIPEQDDRR